MNPETQFVIEALDFMAARMEGRGSNRAKQAYRMIELIKSGRVSILNAVRDLGIDESDIAPIIEAQGGK